MQSDAGDVMKATTVRNLPPEVARAIRERAAKGRTSSNRAIIDLLETAIGGRRAKKTQNGHHDLDRLAGTWSKEEAAAFEAALRGQHAIDPEIWK
jgi:hypothetical protein